MHPTARILLYVLSALALPGLSFFPLAAVAAALLLIRLRAWRPLGRLALRAKWLFLLLLAAHAYQLPGEALWPGLGAAAPTREGLAAGMLQAARLLVMLQLLHALVLAMPTERLVAGVHGLMRPFSPLGLDPARATVRLALTLHAMERRLGSHILHDLMHGRVPGHDLPATQPLAVVEWRWLDGVALAMASTMVAGLWLSA